MGIEWLPSTEKHGVPREDAVHAMLHAFVVLKDMDGLGEPQRGGSLVLWLGPALNPGGPRLEVIGEVIPGGVVQVFHVMEMRSKYQHFLDQLQDERG